MSKQLPLAFIPPYITNHPNYIKARPVADVAPFRAFLVTYRADQEYAGGTWIEIWDDAAEALEIDWCHQGETMEEIAEHVQDLLDQREDDLLDQWGDDTSL